MCLDLWIDLARLTYSARAAEMNNVIRGSFKKLVA